MITSDTLQVINSLWKHLEENPDDTMALSELADLYLDSDDYAMEKAIRWMLMNNKRPIFWREGPYNYRGEDENTPHRWFFWSTTDEEELKKHRPTVRACIGIKNMQRMFKANRSKSHSGNYFTSFYLATKALSMAVESFDQDFLI